MRIRQVVVTGQEAVELQEFDLDEAALKPDDLLVETEATFISAGTELANYTGLDPDVFRPGTWCAYPWKSGYANVGIVKAVGERVTRARVGQRVFTFGPHASAHVYSSQNLVAPVPAAIDPVAAAASRMAGVAATAIHVAAKRHNPWVAVFGLGAVGNLAAQLFAVEGARVIGIEPSARRRDLARACGVPHVVAGTPDEVHGTIREITAGHMADIAVDAVGDSRVVGECVRVAATGGEVIVLGTPRAPVEGSLTPIFNAVHLRWITIKGALEWRLPIYPRVAGDLSQWDKQRMLFDWMERGRLHVDPLVSHVMRPEQIGDAYEGLLREKDEYIGVALDWRAGP